MSGAAATFELRTDGGQRIVVRGAAIAAGDEPAGVRFDVGPGQLVPGLINAHDHLFLNHFPRLGEPPYPNLYAWAEDVQRRFGEQVARHRRLPLPDSLYFGALKNLIGGATTVVHHDTWSTDVERLPIRVARVRVVHSLGLEKDLAAAAHGDDATRHFPLCLHLAEGTDAHAAGEVAAAADAGMLSPDTIAVHVVATAANDVNLLLHSGTAVVWCPTSNLHLYGRTLSRALARSGVDVLIGSDSLLSGDGTLLHELHAARRSGHLDDASLLRAVGATAARRLRIAPPSLEPGAPADVVLFRRPVLDSFPVDVALVIVNGRPRYGDVAFRRLFEASRMEVETITVGGADRLVEAPMGTVARRVLAQSPTCARIFE